MGNFTNSILGPGNWSWGGGNWGGAGGGVVTLGSYGPSGAQGLQGANMMSNPFMGDLYHAPKIRIDSAPPESDNMTWLEDRINEIRARDLFKC